MRASQPLPTTVVHPGLPPDSTAIFSSTQFRSTSQITLFHIVSANVTVVTTLSKFYNKKIFLFPSLIPFLQSVNPAPTLFAKWLQNYHSLSSTQTISQLFF